MRQRVLKRRRPVRGRNPLLRLDGRAGKFANAYGQDLDVLGHPHVVDVLFFCEHTGRTRHRDLVYVRRDEMGRD